MQQLNKISILETVALMRKKRTRQLAMFAERQTRRLTRQPNLAAEVTPSNILYRLRL